MSLFSKAEPQSLNSILCGLVCAPWGSYMQKGISGTCTRSSTQAPEVRAIQFSIQEQLLSRNVERLRGGLVFKAHRFLYHSTLGSRVKKKEKVEVLNETNMDEHLALPKPRNRNSKTNKIEDRNLKPRTQNPRRRTRNPKTETLNPNSTSNP